MTTKTKMRMAQTKQTVIRHVVYHVSHRRLEWALGIGSACFTLSLVVHHYHEHLQKFGEIMLLPAIEAFLSKFEE